MTDTERTPAQSMFYAKVYVVDPESEFAGRHGTVVGYTEDKIQVTIEGKAIDEPVWLTPQQVEVRDTENSTVENIRLALDLFRGYYAVSEGRMLYRIFNGMRLSYRCLTRQS